MKRIVLVILLGVVPLVTTAQKTKKVSGEFVYVIPETESYEQAKVNAVNRAKLQLLADTFGTVMSMSSSMTMSNEGAQVQGLSSSQVKGEWIETIGEPRLSRLFQGDQLAIKVEISGRVREISSATTDFIAKVLCKAPDTRYESTSFQDEDDIFLYFLSPEDGYLTVYLYDGANDVYCLLPYQGQSRSVFPVKGDEEYYFFSKEHPDGITPTNLIVEYNLTASAALEMNRLYVIFSPNRYSKALDSSSRTDIPIPRALSYTNFQKWLSRILAEDSSLGVKMIDISITK